MLCSILIYVAARVNPALLEFEIRLIGLYILPHGQTPCVIPNFQIFDTDQAINGLSVCSFWNTLVFVFWMF